MCDSYSIASKDVPFFKGMLDEDFDFTEFRLFHEGS